MGGYYQLFCYIVKTPYDIYIPKDKTLTKQLN